MNVTAVLGKAENTQFLDLCSVAPLSRYLVKIALLWQQSSWHILIQYYTHVIQGWRALE